MIVRPVNRIIVHHSATPDGKTLSWPDIRRDHMGVRGFNDIGYHYGIEWYENGFETLKGRPIRFPGAHAKGHNSDSIGICLVGNFNLAEPPREQTDMLMCLLLDLYEEFGLLAERTTILAHRDVAHTDCPGRMFDVTAITTAWIEKARALR